MTADLDLSPEAVERLARPIPVSNNLQVTPAITHGYVLELRPVRWLLYKPDGQRQMKQRGRWQEMNEYGGWGNCKTPSEIWPGLTAPDLISDYHAALAENARLRAEVERLRGALEEIRDRHIPDQPSGFGGDELEWATRQHHALRHIAREALKETRHD